MNLSAEGAGRMQVAELLERCQSGDQEAAEELHRRYAHRLWALADRLIGQRLRRRVSPDDLTQSVFRTFFRRTAQGEFSVDHSGSLWCLLARIALNKARRQGKHHRARKRDIAAEVYRDGESLSPELVAHTPTPEEAATLVDELESLLSGLRDPEPEIVGLGLQGFSSSEIAGKVGCSRWTVRRVLDRVGERLRRRLEGDLDN